MKSGYDSSSFSVEDQDLITGLIEAQTAQGHQVSLQSTLVIVQLTDATTVAGTSWANLKSAAVAPGYDTSALSTEDQALITALISAQNVLGLSPLPTAPATVHIATAGHTYSDSTTLSDGTTWSSLKATAMAAEYDVTAETSLSEADKTLVTALIAAQTALS